MKPDPQTHSTLGRPIKTELRCKICASPHRGEIEDLLVLRSDGAVIDTDAGRVRVTEDYIFSIAQERWGFRLNRNNIHTHFSKHFQKGNVAVMAAAPSADTIDRFAEVERRVASGELERRTPEEFLDLVIALGFAKAEADPKNVTIDHALKAVNEKTKRKVNETQEAMLNAMGRVTEKALDRIPLPPPPAPLDGTVEVEAEAVEVAP